MVVGGLCWVGLARESRGQTGEIKVTRLGFESNVVLRVGTAPGPKDSEVPSAPLIKLAALMARDHTRQRKDVVPGLKSGSRYYLTLWTPRVYTR